MIGNDIVSKRLFANLEASSLTLPKRFILRAAKTLTPGEFEFWQRHQKEVLNYSAFWALKEAAYKAYLQLGGMRRFRSKSFRVLWEEVSGNDVIPIVVFGKATYYGKVVSNSAFIHAVVARYPDLVDEVKWTWTRLSESHPETQSKTTRYLLRETQYEHFPGASVKWNARGIPASDAAWLSTSHSDHWGAVAWLPKTATASYIQ